MGTFADSLFTVLMSWVRALVNGVWALFSSEDTTILEFLGKNWLVIALAIIAAGLVIDWLIWLVRWQPYHLWARRVRKLLRMDAPEDDEEDDAFDEEMLEDMERMQQERVSSARAKAAESAQPYSEETQRLRYMPPKLQVDEEEARMAIEQAQAAPDDTLYPGMRYGSAPATAETVHFRTAQPYAAVHSEGPGTAEVTRRRAEIDAWQLQMEEEARQRAAAEQALRQAELERARKEREAEQARLAQEAYEAEQTRLAQEEYARQMAEYERQRAQYELEMAEYERQKAAYDAAMEAQRAAYEEQLMQAAGDEPARRRRQSAETAAQQADVPAQASRTEVLRARMSQFIETEDDMDIAGIASLPPRVDVNAAYRPAKRPTNR